MAIYYNCNSTLPTALLKTSVCQYDGLIMGANVFSSRILILLFNMHKMSSITVSINSGMKLQQNCCQTCISGMLINLLATYALSKLEANFQRNTPFLALSVSLILILAHLILSGKQHSFPCQQTKSVPCSLKLKIFLF